MQNLIIKDAIKKQERNYGIDLLRMVSMFLVCILHTLGHGGVLNATTTQSINYYTAWLLEIAAYCAVNCYALISGYVGVNSKFKKSNICYLWLQVALYSGLSTVLFEIIQPGSYTWKGIFKNFLPVIYGPYWYFRAYFALFFFIPILNFVINNMPKSNLKWSIIFLLILFCTIERLFKIFDLASGYSVWWLLVLYLAGGYIKKYDPLKNVKTKWLVLIWVALILISLLFKLLAETITLKIFGEARYGNLFIGYLSPTIVLVAVTMLVVFSRISFNKKPMFIAFFAPVSFGVYLVHESRIVNTMLIMGRFVSFAEMNPVLMILCVLGTALCIYVVCSLIDYLRLLLFKLIKVKPLLNKAEGSIRNKIMKKEEASKND